MTAARAAFVAINEDLAAFAQVFSEELTSGITENATLEEAGGFEVGIVSTCLSCSTRWNRRRLNPLAILANWLCRLRMSA